MTDRPIVGAVAEELYAACSPAFTDANDPDWHLLSFLGAVGTMLEEVWDVNQLGDEPWSVVLDALNAPEYALGWLAAIAGVRTYNSWTTDVTRAAIAEQDGQNRGTPDAMTKAIQRVLTGDKRVEILERTTSAYHFTVRTYPADTPNAALVSQAILAQKPAGLNFEHLISDAQTYAELAADHANLGAVNSGYTNLHNLLLDI